MSPYKNKEDKSAYQRVYQREWYKNNKEKLALRNKIAKTAKREFVDKIKKENPCIICGEDRWYVLVFHHRNPDEKEFDIAKGVGWNYGYDRLKKEISKCDILCANCHREIHYLEKALVV